MKQDPPRKVAFVTHTVFHYRKEFHEKVHAALADKGVHYHVYYGQPDRKESRKGDTVDLEAGTRIKNRYFYLGDRNPLIFQPALKEVLKSDLVVVIQENRLLINYLLELLPKRLRPKLALFGHGRNFQSRSPSGMAERWKRLWSTRCDWWFAYTEETRKQVEGMGFPAEQITVFNNAVDTSAFKADLAAVSSETVARRREELGLSGGNIGLYVGGLYADKRLEFLVHAADLIRNRIPDFELVVLGGGPSEASLRALAASRPWIKLAGPRFGRDKAELMSVGKVLLMPGLVGLAILDAGVAGLPMITTAFPYHSPEIAYLEHGRNGLIVEDWENPQAYADAVADLLSAPERLAEMSQEARRVAATYTIEAMAERFAGGVLAALRKP